MKQLSPEALTRVMAAIRRETGTELKIARKNSTYVLEVEVPSPEVNVKANTGVAPMEVGHASATNRWAPILGKSAMPCKECKPGMPFPRLS